MAYIPSPAEETHVLVRIELTGATLYYADAHLSMSDGNFYEGRLSVGTLQRAFSSWLEPKQRQSTLTMALEDRDRTVRALLEGYTWGLRRVKVYVGKGRDLGNYTLDFDGIIKFPNGISYDDRQVKIQLRDARNADWLMLPVDKFWTSAYPNLEDGASGTPIPIAYGDWSDTPVPAVCVDRTVNEFKIAGHAVKSIVQVYKNGQAVSHTDADLTAATFRISSYDPLSDTVTVAFQGRMNDAGDLLEHPVDVLRDMQVNYIGIAEADLDAAAYEDLRDELSGFAVRRYISEELSSNTLIEELGIESTFDLLVENGVYTVKSRVPGQTYDTLYDETNIAADSLSVDYDPETLYANRIKCDYAWDPSARSYKSNYQADNAAQQTAVGRVISRTISLNWLYLPADVVSTVQRAMLLYGNETRVVRFTGLGEAILEQLGNRVGLTFANFDGRPLLIREISKNFKTRTCEIAGYDALSYANPGYWTGEDAPDWSAATAAEKAAQGFWTDETGTEVSSWW